MACFCRSCRGLEPLQDASAMLVCEKKMPETPFGINQMREATAGWAWGELDSRRGRWAKCGVMMVMMIEVGK